MTFNIPFKNFPDWAIPMTKVVIIFKEENIHANNLIFSPKARWIWIKDPNNQDYTLRITVAGIVVEDTEDDAILNLFADIKIYLLNERIYDSTQTDGR